MVHVLGRSLRFMLVVYLDLLCFKTQGWLGQKCILDFACETDLKLLWWFTVDIDSVLGS